MDRRKFLSAIALLALPVPEVIKSTAAATNAEELIGLEKLLGRKIEGTIGVDPYNTAQKNLQWAIIKRPPPGRMIDIKYLRERIENMPT